MAINSVNPQAKTDWAILAKALRAVRSCNTTDQLRVAVNYCELAHGQHCAAKNSREFDNDVVYNVKRRQDAIIKAE